jgi:hypothetical protein
MTRTWIAPALASLSLAAAASAAPEQDFNVELYLSKATAQPAGGAPDLRLEFQVRDGQWRKDFLRGRGGGQGRHAGTVKSVQTKDGTTVLTIDLRVRPDLWMQGGIARYTITVKPTADGKGYEGAYDGTYTSTTEPKPTAPLRAASAAGPRGADLPPELAGLVGSSSAGGGASVKPVEGEAIKVSGKVTGITKLPWPAAVKGHVPVEAGEHPRLIFRKADIEKLRKNAQTPEGKAIMERFMKVIDYTQHDTSHKFDSWPGIGLGFAYVMTGDKKYADRAKELVQKKFFDRGPVGGQDIHHGPPAQGLALTFDLCYDGWDEKFRTRVVEELWQRAQECGTGTFAGKSMGGTNWAYWSNHNGVRCGGAGLAALAVWKEKTSSGKVLDAEPMAIAEDMAFDQYGFLRDGLGGGYWFMEGVFYKGMTMVRGMMHSIRAYEMVTGKRINVPGLRDQIITGYFLEAEPGKLTALAGAGVTETAAAADDDAAGAARTPVKAGDQGIDSDSLIEVIWTIGLGEVPADAMPGIKYLLNRNVGLAGDKTFGLERACYAPYLMASYPFDVPEKQPSECFPWISPDPTNGHWVFRNTWKDKDDVLLTWNLLSGVRGSCHYERIGNPSEWILFGLGRQWMKGQYLPIVKGKEKATAKQAGVQTLEWRAADRLATMKFDVALAYCPTLERPRGAKTPADDLAKTMGALKGASSPTFGANFADFGVRGTRHVAVDFSGASGAPLMLVIVEDLGVKPAADAPPQPADFTWALPLTAKAPAEGNSLRVTQGDVSLNCLVLGGKANAAGKFDVAGGKMMAVITLQKGEAPKAQVAGDGPTAKVTIGKRAVQFTGDKLVVE